MAAPRKRNWERLFITPILDAKVRTWRVLEFGYTPVVLQRLPGCHTPVPNGALGVRRWPFAVREKCEEGYTPAISVKSAQTIEKNGDAFCSLQRVAKSKAGRGQEQIAT